jgi:hypothetical protein
LDVGGFGYSGSLQWDVIVNINRGGVTDTKQMVVGKAAREESSQGGVGKKERVN